MAAALPPTTVRVAAHEARLAEGRLERSGQLGVLALTMPVGCREDVFGRRGLHRLSQDGNQLVWDGHTPWPARLGRLATVAPVDEQPTAGEVDVHLPQPEELAGAGAQVNHGQRKTAPIGPEVRNEGSNLLERENLVAGLHLAHPSSHPKRIGPMPFASGDGLVEDARPRGPHLVDGAWTERPRGLKQGCQVVLHHPGCELSFAEPPERLEVADVPALVVWLHEALRLAGEPVIRELAKSFARTGLLLLT